MGISKNQLLSAMNVVKGYSDSELSEAEKRVSALIQALYEVVENNREDPIHQLHENVGLQDTPIGHIMAYMGTTAPKHYLVCDGSVYNIVDYPALASHIQKEFQTVNYFGGDGETTFAVPDLRGEFLRGSGTNDHENQGNGAEVGVHQDGTTMPHIQISSGDLVYPDITERYTNVDSSIKSETLTAVNSNVNSWVTPGASSSITVKPTNTSVLYCIKYEPTYYMRVGSDTDYYQKEEHCVGTWINGEPYYRRVIYDTARINKANDDVADFQMDPIEDAKSIVAIYGTLIDGTATYPFPAVHSMDAYTIGCFFDTNDKTIHLRCGNGLVGRTISARIVVEYTKMV